MLESTKNGYWEAIKPLLAQYPRHIEFPLGGLLPIPTEAEECLLISIKKAPPITAEDVAAIRRELRRHDAYALVVFATRMAVFAARTNSDSNLKAALVGLAIDDCLVDWRDILVSISIIEDCAIRLGVDFATCIQTVSVLAADERRRTIDEGYLPRPPKLRNVEVMGFTAKGIGGELHYVRLENCGGAARTESRESTGSGI